MTDALIVQPETPALAAPALSADAMAQAFTKYRAMQAAIDLKMPDAIITIRDRKFRKKAYWRAVGIAYDLSVDLIEEQRDVFGQCDDGADNFGYQVTYRATSRTGRNVIGDGACYAEEKDPANATIHNVRSHAHTRAFNRAISNLVGFGEVSAEEMDVERPRAARPARAAAPVRPGNDPAVISEAQAKRLFAIARGNGWQEHEIKTLIANQGFEHTREITRDKYDVIIASLEQRIDPLPPAPEPVQP